MAADIIRLTQDAEAHARTETERKRELFAWADDVLQRRGLADSVAQANSFDALRKLKFDADDVRVELAIRDALHPSNGKKGDQFAGIREGALKRLLKARFEEMKRDRERELSGGSAGTSKPNWTRDLKL